MAANQPTRVVEACMPSASAGWLSEQGAPLQGDLYEVKLSSTLGDFANLVARKMGSGWHPENMRFWLWDRAPGGAAHVCLPCYVPGAEHAKTPMSAPSLTYCGLQQDRLNRSQPGPPSSRNREVSLAHPLSNEARGRGP